MSDMLAVQDSLHKASAKELLRTDLLHLSSMEQAKHSEYEPNSNVFVHYRTGAPWAVSGWFLSCRSCWRCT
jgi:hypothetical protein